ncbi:MAG: hypothetical protein U0871_14525 [Gemmataceae bacterium]
MLIPLALLTLTVSGDATDVPAAGRRPVRSPTTTDFIRPSKPTDPPVYAVPNGIAVAVHPAALDARRDGGPRGLLRVGYHEAGRFYLINYIAVEPLVGKARGYSELEPGGDGKPGKRFTVSEFAGTVADTPAGRTLTITVEVEPFKNGARPRVEVTLFEKQPDRIRLRAFDAGGTPMRECVLTATMGNQSRCRHLWLKDEAVFAPGLYAGYTGTDFVEKKPYPLAALHRTPTGDVVAAISPDEPEPRAVRPFPNGAWHHPGAWMGQFWLKPADGVTDALAVRVNGRRTYWAGKSPIPGGIAFENFELREPFRDGQEQWFGFTRTSPAKAFGFPYDVAPAGRR